MIEPEPGAHDVVGLLASWLPRQRWFAAGPGGVTLVPAGRIVLATPTVTPLATGFPAATASSGTPDLPVPPSVGVTVHIVSALPAGSVPESSHSGTGANFGSNSGVGAGVGTGAGRSGGGSAEPSATYQVPLTYRSVPVPELAHALVGELRTADGPLWVYDGPHDPVFVAAWIRLVSGPDEATSFPGTPRSRVRGVRRAGESAPNPARPARVLSGEQSNTSIIVGADEGSPDDAIMVKLFRVLQPGRNPDVVVPGALSGTSTDRVPRLIGWVEGEWVQTDGQPAWGHLSAFAEFIAGGHDGWRIACTAIEAGSTFAAMSYQLGQTTAEVHSALAQALPTRPTTAAGLVALADHLDSRLSWAVSAAPALAEHATAAAAVIDGIRSLTDAPDQQIIHGDYHLGQALYKAGRGWVLLDFEGEPLRPLAERGDPDLALRDVAGMLRSFDYAARHSVLGLADDDPRALSASAWARESREAFLAGYAAESGRDPGQDDVLLRALELDKALYETVYETRHRPGWVEVPLRAVGRLLAAREPVTPVGR